MEGKYQKFSSRNAMECMDWISVAQDRSKWWVILKAVTNCRVP